ncbi:MAG: DUF192 domain-containing protein [Goleter apudmare HA4340-LM2]|jgi:hypothetical protein|nr:DUF192 domain-containing protein [Goleter apudmare HA4340-LM2]
MINPLNKSQATTLSQAKNSHNSFQFLLKCLNIIGPIAGISLAVGSMILSILALAARSPQQLPITAIAKVGSKQIQLEVAQTPKHLALGLKYRKELPENRGMLFEIAKTQKVEFWMKDVQIPLDIIFLQNGVVKTVVKSAPPCSKEPCPFYHSAELVNRVLEIPAGSAVKLGIKSGTTVIITKKP